MKILSFLLLAVCISATAYSEALCSTSAPRPLVDSTVKHPQLEARDIPGWTSDGIRSYKGSQLYGYIDGGAETYYEYGFTELSMQTIHCGMQEIMIEIYVMDSPEAAFGIFAVTHPSCPQKIKGVRWSCAGAVHTSFARGRYCISFTYTAGGARSADTLLSFARKTLKKITDKDFIVPKMFDRPKDKEASVAFLAGPLGTQNYKPDWAGYFKRIKQFSMHTLSTTSNSCQADIAAITFQKAEDLKQFLMTTGFRDTVLTHTWTPIKTQRRYIAARLVEPNKIIYAETAPDCETFQEILKGF